MSASTSSGSGSTLAAPSADELLQNLIDSVTPTSSSPAPAATTSAPHSTATATPAAAAATASPSDEKSTSSSADNKSASGSGGANAGLSIGLAVGAVVVVAVVVLFFRQRKRRRYSAPAHHRENDLGTPQLSIELPQPPHLDASTSSSHMKRPSEQRLSVFSSVQNGGESVFTAAGEVSPGFYSSSVPRSAPLQYRVSNNPQTGPASTTFRMDSSANSSIVTTAFNPATASFNPAADSTKTNKLTRVVSGRVLTELESDASALPLMLAKTDSSGSLSRDTTGSTASLNSLHDSMCGDYYKHGDGLGERIRAKSRAKHPSMVLEEDEDSNRLNAVAQAAAQVSAPVSAPVAAPTPKTFATVPATPTATAASATVTTAAPAAKPPMPAPRRPPPPPPPAAAFVKPPSIATSDSQMYRPSTESEIAFQRLSTVSTDSLGSVKRVSTSSVDSSNPRAGSMIEINEIVGGDGSDGAKEIEI